MTACLSPVAREAILYRDAVVVDIKEKKWISNDSAKAKYGSIYVAIKILHGPIYGEEEWGLFVIDESALWVKGRKIKIGDVFTFGVNYSKMGLDRCIYMSDLIDVAVEPSQRP
jgi:hypothetical protein